jgi:hypothetical protein
MTKKLFYIGALVALTVTVGVNAGSIKTWTTETLRYSDLNSNFEHIHNTMVGGHGARLVDADVSSSAAISHSKMATPALLPKAWANMNNAACAAGNCTLNASSGVSSVAFSATGRYTVTLSTTRANANYAVVLTDVYTGSALARCVINAAKSTTGFSVACFNTNTGADINSAFDFVVMDNDN